MDGIERPTHDPDSRGSRHRHAVGLVAVPRLLDVVGVGGGVRLGLVRVAVGDVAVRQRDERERAEDHERGDAEADRLERDVAVCSDSSAARARIVASVIRAPFGFASRAQAVFSLCGQARTCPEPRASHLVLVSSARPIGPRACSFWVEMPTSAPKPNSPPSVKRVEAFAITTAESTSARKRSRVRVVLRDDRLGVVRRVAADVVERVVEVVDDPHRDVEAQVLGRPVLLGGRDDAVMRDATTSASPCTVTPCALQRRDDGRHEALGRRPMHQHGLDGVAHARALHLRVDDDVARPLQRRGLVEHDVDDAGTGLDHRDRATR